jgi:hypothetical protein
MSPDLEAVHAALLRHVQARSGPVGYWINMRPSYPFDPELHRPGSVAARGGCSWHGSEGVDGARCEGAPVVSFQDEHGCWQSGCLRALEDLVDRGEIERLGQGA